MLPDSNVALGGPEFKAILWRLRDAGGAVKYPTDDPPFFNTDMRREFAAVAQHFGWGAAEFAEVTKTALEAAFAMMSHAAISKQLAR